MIGYIGSESEPAFAKFRLHRLIEILATGKDIHERTNHSYSCIARPRAAQSDNEIAAAPLYGSRQQLPHSIRGGTHRIALILLYEIQSTCLCHLYYRRAVWRNAILGIHPTHHLVVDIHRLQCSAEGCGKGMEHPVASV